MNIHRWVLPLALLASIGAGAWADDKGGKRGKDDVRVERHWEDRDGRRLDHREALGPREQIEREGRRWRDRDHYAYNRDRDRDDDDRHRRWRDRDDDDRYRYHSYTRIPPGHLPPPGECRIWFEGRPPGHQPPPGSCRYLSRRVPPGAFLVWG